MDGKIATPTDKPIESTHPFDTLVQNCPATIRADFFSTVLHMIDVRIKACVHDEEGDSEIYLESVSDLQNTMLNFQRWCDEVDPDLFAEVCAHIGLDESGNVANHNLYNRIERDRTSSAADQIAVKVQSCIDEILRYQEKKELDVDAILTDLGDIDRSARTPREKRNDHGFDREIRRTAAMLTQLRQDALRECEEQQKKENSLSVLQICREMAEAFSDWRERRKNK